jgi:hypothetical protein
MSRKAKDAAPPPELEPRPDVPLLPAANATESTPARMFNGREIPAVATHFRVRRETGEGDLKEKLSFGQREGVAITEWPVEELTGAEILRRHGPGKYRIVWVVNRPGSKYKVLPGASQSIELGSQATPPIEAGRGAGADAAVAPPGTWSCCGNPWPDACKFCALCGRSQSAAKGGGISSLVGGDMLAGIQLAMSLMRETRESAESEADRRIARERQDFEMRMARERHQYDMDMRAQQARHDMMMRDAGKSPDVDPRSIAEQVSAALGARLDDLEESIDEVRDEAEQAGKKVDSTLSTVVNLAKEHGPMLAPLVQALVTKLATPATVVTNGVPK